MEVKRDVYHGNEKRCRVYIMERERDVGYISWKEMQGCITERDVGGVSWKWKEM